MDLFVLGIERSASTWVSSIFDSHPETAVYLEPLSDFSGFFNKWPIRFKRIKDKKYYAEYFMEEIEKIKKSKRLLFTKLSDKNYFWNIDFKIAKSLLSKVAPSYCKSFKQINFHKANSDFCFMKSNVKYNITKELRLNFNADIIQYINDKSKVIITLRDYGATIKSICKYVKRDRLIELAGIMDLTGEKGDYVKLMKYWFNSYNTLLNTLDKHGIDYHIVWHRDLLTNTEDKVRDMFKFSGMKITPQVRNYLQYSNKENDGIHNTNRNKRKLLEREVESRKEVAAYLKNDSELRFNSINNNLRKYFTPPYNIA